ncbi:MAG: hypothetical protein VX899_03945 [Myxococcota bacterium]|nr:hypothetical protein [Myxococcota bacterium]
MSFLLLHISLWIFLAVVVGAAIGWMMRKLTSEEETTGLHEQERRRQAELEATRAALAQTQQQAAAARTLQQKAEADLAALELSRPVAEPDADEDEELVKRVAALTMELGSVREQLHISQVELHEAQSQPRPTLGPSPVELQVSQAKAATLELKLGESRQRRNELEQELEALRLEMAALRREQDLPASRPTQLELMKDSGGVDQQLQAARSRLEELETAHQELLAQHTELLSTAGEAIAPEWLLEAPQGLPDDLKRIKGIGPVLSATLNKLGIYHFHQLARLEAAEAAWLAAQLGTFPGRIFRDRWVQQARELGG